MVETPDWHTLNDDYYLALGKLVVASSHLESTVFRRLASLIDFWGEMIDDDGATMLIVGTMNFTTALTLLGKLAALNTAESDADIGEWLIRAKAAMENRNRFVHWEWYRDDDEPGTAYIQAFRRQGLQGQDGVTSTDVDTVTRELLAISAALSTITIRRP